jgi:hypothetical protein
MPNTIEIKRLYIPLLNKSNICSILSDRPLSPFSANSASAIGFVFFLAKRLFKNINYKFHAIIFEISNT